MSQPKTARTKSSLLLVLFVSVVLNFLLVYSLYLREIKNAGTPFAEEGFVALNLGEPFQAKILFEIARDKESIQGCREFARLYSSGYKERFPAGHEQMRRIMQECRINWF